MPKLTPPLTYEQQIAIAIIPKFTATLSLIGSGYIVQHVLRSKKRRGRVYHRVLLGMSLIDVMMAVRSFLSTWPIPRGSPGVWGAAGTTQTCAAAGFFGHGPGLSSALYNGSLTLYYVLTIRQSWRHRDSDARLRRLEPWLHAVPLCVGWATAIAGLPLLLYNSIGWTCWIAPLPMNCRQTYQYGYTTCERGDNSYVYRWAFFHAVLWATFFLTAVGMALVYGKVLQTEKATEQYKQGHQSMHQRKRAQSRKVAHQAMLYVAAYYLTWIFPTVTWLTQLTQGQTYTIVLFLQVIFVPLQGMFNVLIYLRPRYLQYRESHPDEPYMKAIRSALSSSVPSRERAQRSQSPGGSRRWGQRDMDVHSFYYSDSSNQVSWLQSSYHLFMKRLRRDDDLDSLEDAGEEEEGKEEEKEKCPDKEDSREKDGSENAIADNDIAGDCSDDEESVIYEELVD